MKTVKVKVAVAVDRTGGWCAAGWTDSKDDERIDAAAEHVEPGERVYWLTAELQVPEGAEAEEISADVTDAADDAPGEK